MHSGTDVRSVVLRRVGVSAAVLLQILTAACGREPSALDSNANLSNAGVLSGVNGRVIEAGEPRPSVNFQRPGKSALEVLPPRLRDLRGVAVDPTSGHVHVLDPVAQLLHEVAQTGRIVATRDVSALRLVDPQGMTFAPSRDLTDDPSELSLFVSTGEQVVELSFDAAVAATATPVPIALVRTTRTSQYSPPSPDPSGIAYATHLGRLVIGDGEVNEMSIYAGANMYETTLSGTLSRAWTTLAFSKEPTGVAYNPVNRHLFVSDDDDRQIYEVDPGADGQYGTSDDRLTSFDTQVFGSTDPEGLAYDPAQRILFIADGVNAQVYRITPGANGVFDGVAPAGDDQVTSFDTEVHGLRDPEGIAYDSDFGHLYVVGSPSGQVFELSTTGALLGILSIAVANPDKSAGLEFVPASVAGRRTLYVVDRGEDNDSDPNENDGSLYEFALPAHPGNAPPTVTITSPPDGHTVAQGTAITFTATASDAEDGDLAASITWISSRDGALGSGASVSTSLLSAGTHTITASVTDAAGAEASASITVTVSSGAGTVVVQVRVAAGSDDAEESPAGALDLSSSDLELTVDGAVNQTIGLRFNGVTVPRGATITRAFVQFQVDETSSDPSTLTVAGQAADNPVTFSSTAKIASRPRTANTVSWSPVPWTTVGQAGTGQQTPDLSTIVQEIVGRPGWVNGNSLAIIITGTGRRVAEAQNGLPAAAPLLRVEYASGPNTTPTASNVAISGTPQVGRTLTGNYSYNDANGDAEGASTYRWLREGTQIDGAAARSYTLTSADLGALIVFEVTPVAATGPSPGAPVQSAAVGPIAAPPPPATFVEVRVAAGSDDAEESPSGSVDLSSSDLELIRDGSTNQTIGLRFNGVAIPQGATITRAWVQFQVDETGTEATSLTIAGQAADNPVTFSSTNKIAPRARTAAAVAWSPPAWTTVGQAGTDQRTPDLSAVVQEIVSRPGWQSGNSLAIIITGSGRRTAEAFNGVAAAAPLLRVEFAVGSSP